MRNASSPLAGALLLLVSATAARADDTSPPPSPTDGWTVTLKGRLYGYPSYPGSSSMTTSVLPGLNLRRAGANASFVAPDDAVGLALFDIGWLKAGPAARFIDSRGASSHPELHGIHDVDWTIEAGGFIEIWPMERLRTRLDLRRGFNGEEGLDATLSADWIERHGGWTFSGGPRLALNNDHFSQAYFSVSPEEAAVNGRVSAFEAKGGLRSIGLAAAATYQWTPQWSTTIYANYDRLVGDAARSPITAKLGTPDQFTIGMILAYSFTFNGFGWVH